MFKQSIGKWWHHLRGRQRTPKFYRGQEKFRARYPTYQIGIGTSGMPEVFDWHEGSTFSIGAYCSISSDVKVLLGGGHRIDWASSYPFPAFLEEARHISDYRKTRGDINIGSDVWLGMSCTILSGVTIGHGAVVAACAVVTRDVEPYAIVAGNPARVVRWRFDEDTRRALLATAWWTWSESEVREIVDLLCSDDVKPLIDYARRRNTPR